MRPIDADAFFENLTGYAAPEMVWDAGDIEHKLDEMPTLTLDDLRSKGEWVKNGWNDYSCSKCETQYVGKGASAWNYCPNCGHPMEVGGE